LKSELDMLHSDFYSESLNDASGLFEADVNLNNTFNYDQQIHAAYGILGTEVGRFGFQAGVRLEQAMTTFDLRTTDESFDNNYFSAFPSAFMTYKASETGTFRLAYSKRINRPRTGGRFNQLNPFNSNEDPYFRRVGNPYLKPEYVHAFELSFTKFTKATSLTLTPYFRHTVDVIRFYQTFEEGGVSVMTFENFDTSNSWGTEVIGTYRQGQRFNAYASVNVFRVVTDGSNVDSGLSNNALGFSSRFNATVNVSPSLDLQFSYFYRAPMKIENGRTSARQSANLAVRQKLFGDRANLSLRVSDIFGTMGFSMLRDDARFFQETNRSFQSQGVGLNFSYNFGKPIKRNRTNRRDEGAGAGPEEVEIEM
jgi:outer membrane cobalamin receptor